MDFNTTSAIAAVFSSVAAAFSAIIAYRANCAMAKADRDGRVRDVSLLANKVKAGAKYAAQLADQLDVAYTTLFSFAGGAMPKELERRSDEINKKKHVLETMQ